jgi:hypothetical protein
LRAAATAASSATTEEILEAEKIAEDIVEILEDSVVKSLPCACAGEAGMTVRVVNLALLLVAQDTVCFGALAEFYFRLGFVLRASVRVPLQRGFAIGGFDLLDRRRPRNGEHFVIIALSSLGHETF